MPNMQAIISALNLAARRLSSMRFVLGIFLLSIAASYVIGDAKNDLRILVTTVAAGLALSFVLFILQHVIDNKRPWMQVPAAIVMICIALSFSVLVGSLVGRATLGIPKCVAIIEDCSLDDTSNRNTSFNLTHDTPLDRLYAAYGAPDLQRRTDSGDVRVFTTPDSFLFTGWVDERLVAFGIGAKSVFDIGDQHALYPALHWVKSSWQKQNPSFEGDDFPDEAASWSLGDLSAQFLLEWGCDFNEEFDGRFLTFSTTPCYLAAGGDYNFHQFTLVAYTVPCWEERSDMPSSIANFLKGCPEEDLSNMRSVLATSLESDYMETIDPSIFEDIHNAPEEPSVDAAEAAHQRTFHDDFLELYLSSIQS